MSFVTGPQSVEHIYTRACELARQWAVTPGTVPRAVRPGLRQYRARADARARALAEEFLELAEPQHDALCWRPDIGWLAYAAWWQGDFIDVRDHSRQGLQLLQPDQHPRALRPTTKSGIVCGYLDALADWVLGYPTQAVQAMDRTLAHAKELEHPYSVGHVASVLRPTRSTAS